jgi:uncharacterized membrane protein YkoI
MLARLPILAALLAIQLASAPMLEAQQLIDPRQRGLERRSGGISLDQAVRMAERRYNAKAVKVDSMSDGERRVYQIRLLNTEGKVWTVRVDAQSGDMY